MLQDLSNIEADFSAEAKDSAIQRISDILRHPDDLTNKLDKIRKKIGHERAIIEAQLKTALEAQLENVGRGLDANEMCKNMTLRMKDSLLSMDALCSNSQNTIKNYAYIKKTKIMADQFKTLNDQVERTARLLDQDCSNLIGPNQNMLLVHYQLQQLEKFRNDTMMKARGSSLDILSVLSNAFKKVDALEQNFDKYIWDIAKNVLELLKTNNLSTIVRLIKIIEMEERFDESAAILDYETDDPMDKYNDLEFARGRKIKAYRIKFFDILRSTVVNDVQKIYDQYSEDVDSLLNEMWRLVDDLVLINDELVPLCPKRYNIFRFFALETHRAIYEILEKVVIGGNIGPGDILFLLKWVRNYYSDMRRRLDVSEELLEPRLLGDREEELVTGYISLVRDKLTEWLANILHNESVHFLARSSPPEQDANGHYLSSGSVIVFKMLNQQIDVALSSSKGQLLYDVILVCTDVLEEYQNTWMKLLDQEYQKFVDKSPELSDGLPEYIMAFANDALKSSEFSENIRDRLVTEAEESFKPSLEQKIKQLLEGFMKLTKKAYQVLIDIVLQDTKPAINLLHSSPQWYDQPVMSFIVGTFDDYCNDFRSHLNEYVFNKLLTDLLDRFLILYIETFNGKNVKFNIPEAGEKLRNDLNSIMDLFSKSKSQKRIKASFECIDRLVSLIESNPRLIYIDFFGLYKAFPDVNIDFIEKILSKRSDMDKAQVKEIMEGIRSKVEEDMSSSYYKETSTVFSRIEEINIPGPAGSLPRLTFEEKKQLFSSASAQFIETHVSKTDMNFESVAWINATSVNSSVKLIEATKLKCIPNLVVMIVSIKVINDQTIVVVKDESGIMNGILDSQVFNLKLQTGCVLELENVGLFKPFKEICSLMITMDTIKSVYENGERRVFQFSKEKQSRIDPDLLSEFVNNNS